MRACFLVYRGCILDLSSHGKRGKGPPLEDTNTIHEGHLLIQSHRRLRIQYEFWGEHKHLDHSIVFIIVGSHGGGVFVFAICSSNDKRSKNWGII